MSEDLLLFTSSHGVCEPTEAGTLLGELADPKCFHDPIAIDGCDKSDLRAMLRMMKLIRQTEEMIGNLNVAGEVRCPCHLAIGQEACAVGVATVLDPERDRVFGAHRSHGHYLALGGDVEALFAEILGRETGCSRGMGGSMHLIAPEKGLLGTVPIVGATVPMAVGAALAAQMDGSGGVAVSFFGDGAVEEGVVQESMNYAAQHAIPVIFACENNLFASHMRIGLRQPTDSVARFAAAHRIRHETLDGNDIVAVAKASRRSVERSRAGEGPSFLELVTYRWRGHVGPREDVDVGVRRSGDLPGWKRRDPIARLASAMTTARILGSDELLVMDQDIEAVVQRALESAREAPFPESDATTRYLYSEQIG